MLKALSHTHQALYICIAVEMFVTVSNAKRTGALVITKHLVSPNASDTQKKFQYILFML